MKSEWNDNFAAMGPVTTVIPCKYDNYTSVEGELNPTMKPCTQDIVKNYAFKLKLFSIQKKRNISELKDEKEASRRLLYKCPYCDKLYSNVTRFEVHVHM